MLSVFRSGLGLDFDRSNIMRQLEPAWKASHECRYVNIQGRPQRLDPDEKKSQDEYHQLVAGSQTVGPKTLVPELVNELLDCKALAITKRHASHSG
jgi:hypothetical protein